MATECHALRSLDLESIRVLAVDADRKVGSFSGEGGVREDGGVIDDRYDCGGLWARMEQWDGEGVCGVGA
jgi:hypothetical protein